MRNLKLEGVLTGLIGIAGTILMSWSIFAEEPPGTVGFFGLLMFAVGMVLAIGILLEFFFIIRKRKIDMPERLCFLRRSRARFKELKNIVKKARK